MEILKPPKNIKRRGVSTNFENWVNILTTKTAPEETGQKSNPKAKQLFSCFKRIIQK